MFCLLNTAGKYANLSAHAATGVYYRKSARAMGSSVILKIRFSELPATGFPQGDVYNIARKDLPLDS